MNVNFPRSGAPVQPASIAQQAAASGVTASKATQIDALEEHDAMGSTEASMHPQPRGTPASPAQVRQNLKYVVDNLPLDMAEIFIAVRKNAQEIRKANVLVRDMGFQAQFDELAKSAIDMKSAADFRLYAGLIQSTVQIGMAASQVYSSAQAGKVAAQGIDPQQQGQVMQDDAMNLNAAASELELQAQAARTETAAATSESAALAEHAAAPLDKDLATRQTATTEPGLDIQAEEQIQQTQGAHQPADTETLDGTHLADESARRADPSAEELEAHAGVLRKHADELKAEAATKFQEAKDINAKADGIRSKWDVYTKGIDGLLGQTSTAYTKFQAETHDLDAKGHEVEAKQHEAESARANDAIQSAREIAQEVLQKMEAMEQARHETNRAIQRNMG